MARRSKMSDERVAGLLNALRVGNTRRGACAHADIAPDTFYRWLGAERTFSDAVEKAEGEAESRYLTRIAQAATGGTWQAAAWWLERRRPADFALRERLDLIVDVRRDIERLATTPEEAEAALAEVQRIIAEGRR